MGLTNTMRKTILTTFMVSARLLDSYTNPTASIQIMRKN